MLMLEAGPGFTILGYGGEDSTDSDRHLALSEAFYSSPGPPGVRGNIRSY